MINSAILPIALVGASSDGDLGRASLLTRSLSQHWKSRNYKFHLNIIARDLDFEAIKDGFESFENLTIDFYKESEFISECFKYKISGWYKQQLIKLIAPTILFTDYFFTLDSDLLVIRDFDENTFIGNHDKPIPKLSPANIHAWWSNASTNLGFKLNREYGFGVTPNILNVQILKSIHNYCLSTHSMPLIEWLCKLVEASPHNSAEYAPWSEYAIFDLAGSNLLDFDDYYDLDNGVQSKLHASNAVWGKTLLTSQEEFVKTLGDGHFLIMQSTSHVDLEMRNNIFKLTSI